MNSQALPPFIDIQEVAHSFVKSNTPNALEVLKPTSFAIRKGELISFIGPSGCGKSTLLNVMGGLLQPKSGRVLLDQKEITSPHPSRVAYVFQENALFPWNTVLENITIALTFQNIPKIEHLDRAKQALSDVGLLAFANHYPDEISGGMKQRAALARALCLETDVILMDEPFAALDEQTRMVLGEDLSVLLSKTQKTIVLVTHSLGEAVFLSDRVAVFSARPGTIKEIIDIEEAHPRKSEFVTSEKFNKFRNQLYSLLHEEVKKTITSEVVLKS